MSLVRYIAAVVLCTTAVGLGSCRAGNLDKMDRPEIEKTTLYDGNIAKPDDVRAHNFFIEGSILEKINSYYWCLE